MSKTRKKSKWSLDRRDVLKLFPQTAAYFALASSARGLTPSSEIDQVADPNSVPRAETEWAAEWIWEPVETTIKDRSARVVVAASKTFRNVFTYFRKTIDLSEDVKKAPVRISGDGRYKLYVNGHYVGRGPVRCSPVWHFYDEYNIGPLLRKGRNSIAVLLHSYGESTGWYMLSRPGLAFECGLELASGKNAAVKSDETWRFLRSSAYRHDTPRKNDSLGFVEIYDARKAPGQWTTPEFDDSSWMMASVIAKDSDPSDMPRVIPPFPCDNLVGRGIPMLLEREIVPSRVLTVGEVQNLSSSFSSPTPLSPAEQMRQEPISSLETCVVQNSDSLTIKSGETIVRTSPGSSAGEGKSAVLVLDFGRQVTGYPRLELDGVEGGIVDIGVSESLCDGRVTPTRNGLHCNRYIMTGGPQEWEAFEWDGFRYLQLTIRNCAQPITLRKVAVNFTSYPVGNRGTFESSDAALNKIWEACRHTVQLCMHDAYEDCPNREQRQWVGDAYIESKVNFAIFGDTKLAAQLLRQFARSQRADGISEMYYPGDVNTGAIGYLSIRDFTLHWVGMVWEYYRYTGDAEILRELYPNIVRALGWFEDKVGPNGLLSDVPPWIFCDWAEIDKRGESTILNAFFCNALKEVVEIARVVGMNEDRLRFTRLADRIKIAINERLWDENRGVYVDARVGGQSRRVSQQSNSLCLLYDIAAPERRSRILAYIFSKDRIKGWQGPSIPALITSPLGPLTRSAQDFNEETDVVQAQPFFMHWVNAALAHVGEQARMVEVIRQNWGKMIDAGATTIWETWSPDASECHGWGATPAYDLTTQVLGVRGVTPGFREIAIEPHPENLRWARGSVPCTHGDISVSWQSSAQEFQIEGSRPLACGGSVLIPLETGASPREILVNGNTVWRENRASGSTNVAKEKGGIRVALPQGKFAIRALYGDR